MNCLRKKGICVFLVMLLVYTLAAGNSVYALESNGSITAKNFSVRSVSATTAVLEWDSNSEADGYIIYSYNAKTKKYSKVKQINEAKTKTVNLNNLKSGTTYRYAIRTFEKTNSGTKYSAYSPILKFTTNPASSQIKKVNNNISNGYFAQITNKPITIKGNVLTTSDGETETYIPDDEYYKKFKLLIRSTHGDYGAVSEITQFFDCKGYYTVVYEGGNYLYFDRYSASLKKASALKIKKLYPLLGDVITDKNGNYYVVWGKEDTAGKGGVVTMAVSKYSYKGSHIKTVTYKTKGGRDSWETKIPFDAGNCDTIIDNKGILICNYGRVMYNGHQSNDILCVNTSTMKKTEGYYNYVSHSFDQRALLLSDGGVCLVNKGDGYPRGFDVQFYNTAKQSGDTFHFYGGLGANNIQAWLGGVVEVGGNVYLVGSSAKTMTNKFMKEGQNLFVQLVGDNRKISGSSSRKGTSDGKSYTDTGVKWLTSYGSGYSVANPQVVATDDGRFVIMWEKMKTVGYEKKFSQSYYMILDADATVIQKAAPMNGVRLTSHEDPVYRSGYIYWTTAGEIQLTSVKVAPGHYTDGYILTGGNKGVIHKLKVDSVTNQLETPAISSVSNASKGITVKWTAVTGAAKYRVFRKTGKGAWLKLTDTTATSFTDTTAQNGQKYVYTVRCISSNGKKYTSKYNSVGKSTVRMTAPALLKYTVSKDAVSLKWSTVSGCVGYEIQYSTSKSFEGKSSILTVTGGKTVSKQISKLSMGKTYYIRIRAYNKLNGTKCYSLWSSAKKVKIG